jgi:aldose 1-epimerase
MPRRTVISSSLKRRLGVLEDNKSGREETFMQTSYELLILLSASLCAAGLLGCAAANPAIPSSRMQVSKLPFGKTADGASVDIFTLRNKKGAEARILNYGGIVVSLTMPDRNGQMGDVTLGYDNLESYLKDSPFFGALVGRYGNRIARGKFTLNGKEYTLAINNGPNALHGGIKGFDKVIWEARTLPTTEGPALELRYVSKDGEEGYPGNLSVTAVYTLTENNALKIQYSASTDQETILNLTHHSYFNLAGKGDVLNYQVMIPADTFTPVDSTLIPTGELKPVEGTPFDFRKPTAIGARIDQDDEQLKFGGGYDHNWVIKKPLGKLGLMARVYDPASGRVLEVLSTEPGLQFYTANHLAAKIPGKGGWMYKARNAFCMEPEHYPDSPNHPDFPSVVLKPNEVFENTIIYKFSVQR